ncbi:hypothetical protein [Vibrio variabilis]|uniref:hypothetical protein n=1 Tax=Vibrio variabilis TaxID=990271 RepID=UPI000DD6C5D1|nr:hypothetical protein [Vibrio variabilis]
MQVTATNKSHQAKVNRFIRWDEKYNALVDAEKDGTSAAWNAYDKAAECWEELPKRERTNIAKHIDTTGY